MKTTSIPLSLLALVIASRFCAGSQTPGLQWDPETVDSCIEWYDNGEGETCEYIRKYFGITPEEFSKWNPSVGLDCKPWRYQSCCIVTKERLATSALSCYVDNSTLPILEERVSKEGGDASLTISKCQNACYLAQLEFAGVKGGNECWCSSFVGGELASNKTECNMPCSGDKAKNCGGKDRINVFTPGSDDEGEVDDEGKAIKTESSTSGAMKYRALF